MKPSLIFLWVLVALFTSSAMLMNAAAPTQLNFTKGQQIVYSLNANIDARGQVMSTSAQTSGSVSSMTSTLVILCQEVRPNSFLFVANMFDTSVHVEQERTSRKLPLFALPTASGAQPLGYDVYFEQQKSGEITTIWYNKKDESYVLNVKLSAINSLQTRVTQPGQSQSAVEQDPSGVHLSQFVGSVSSASNDDSVHVIKTFDQQDFEKFADPSLTKKNVAVQATTSTNIHSSGLIAGSTVEQTVLFVNMARQSSSSASPSNSDQIGFDMDMKSRGVLSIAMKSQSIVSATNNDYFAEGVMSMNKAALSNEESLQTGTLFDIASDAVAISKATQLPILSDSPSIVLKQVMMDSGCIKKHYNTIQNLIIHLNQDETLQVNALLEPFFVEFQEARSNDKIYREKLLFIATGMNRENVHNLLIKYGLKNKDRQSRYHSIVSIGSGIKQPSSFLITSILQHFYANINDAEMSDATLLAFGSLLSQNNVDKAIAQEGASNLIKVLAQSIKTANTTIAVSALGAISNAGSSLVPLSAIPAAVFTSGDLRVRMAAAFALKNYEPSTYPEVAQNMMRTYPFASDPDFPYNKNYTVDYTIGGEKISADFNANLFVGTNFDCNHPSFNYKALAEATANINILGIPQPALDARAVYGKRGGQVIGNELFLSVFGKVVYQKSLALVDCGEHSYHLYHAAPGVSLSYTVWISVVPVTFKASASLILDASWGWQICDSQLSAMAQIVPSATVVLAGNAEINLLIVRGGIELNARFNADVIPQAYIHGTTCTVGIDVKLQTQPMSAALEGYYATKVCHFLKFFDCKWDKQGRVTFWGWSLPSQDKILYKQEWQIKPE